MRVDTIKDRLEFSISEVESAIEGMLENATPFTTVDVDNIY